MKGSVETREERNEGAIQEGKDGATREKNLQHGFEARGAYCTPCLYIGMPILDILDIQISKLELDQILGNAPSTSYPRYSMLGT